MIHLKKGKVDTVAVPNDPEYLALVEDLLSHPKVQEMSLYPQHGVTNCLEHCVHVSYLSYLFCTKHGLNARSAARAGLLHDLYLYDPKSLPSYKQCFAHPVAALRNAAQLCGELTAAEADGILCHMWPMARHIPRCREAAAVCLADKLCATAEVLQIWRRSALRVKCVHFM